MDYPCYMSSRLEFLEIKNLKDSKCLMLSKTQLSDSEIQAIASSWMVKLSNSQFSALTCSLWNAFCNDYKCA